MIVGRDRRSQRGSRIESANYRLFLVVAHGSSLGLVAHIGFIPLFLWLGVPVLAWFNVASVAVWALAKWLNVRGEHPWAIQLITIEVILHALLATALLGWASGFPHYLVTLVTFTMFNYRLRNALVALQAIAIVLLYAGLFHWTHAGGLMALPDATLAWLQFGNILISFLTLALVSFYFREASLQTVQSMAELAHTDQLTGLPNRRKLWERLEGEHLRSQHQDRPFVVIMADIDHFKAINDQHGHEAGDAVLCHVSELLKACLREQDTVGRWGGEEFLLILPQMSKQDGVRAAERMREAVAKSPLLRDGKGLSVTLSFGVDDCPPGADLDRCLRQADTALYQAKAEGRNRVLAAETG
ncbi:GGDEF domain-containing protein [Permianibacter sp. IMCC34836]|uniref:GGDEF domain-containing protein n=1 Tax=Permianibacter fluminis TaxID=2738515 RepID=UPI001553C3C1|nr:GGDEF domain-containing protein [Permianibacter fluminis]NQD35536.1 GGDEF domain-containing protein [Permianibacter fluminis]